MVNFLGGYRLLRTVGIGPRAEVFLAHPVREDADAAPVVIKVYGDAVSDESVTVEIEALSRAAGDHVVRLIDVTSTPEGAPALILERKAAGSLARLLGERPRLEAGEAITVLAPLAMALARMHSAGVAHGAVGPGAVLFDASGSPSLACFGRAALFSPGLPAAGLEAEQAVLADLLAFGSLAAGILEGAGAASLAHRARTEAAPGAWLIAFAESLFELAEALPVDLRPRPQPVAEVFPARVVTAAPVPVDEEPAAARWRVQAARVRQSLAAVRRPVWFAAGAALAALVVALAVVPHSEEPARADPSATPAPVVAQPGNAEAGNDEPRDDTPPDDAPVTADDPVAAAIVLLESRELCIRELSEECLHDVDQPDSAALDADREILRAILEGTSLGPMPKVDAGAVALVQRLGDSALVSLRPEGDAAPDSEPASVLLVKGEAGWRIRDYLR